jgi:V8-like Glu-specific endopeptidase
MKAGLIVALLSRSPDTRATAQTTTYTHIMRASGLAWWIVRTSAVSLALMTLGTGCAAEAQGANDTEVVLGAKTNIFGGEGDDDQQAVRGVVALKVGSGGTFELCSGALVAPNVVLTARHCVANSITTSVACDAHGRSANGKHVAGEQEPSSVAIYTGSAPKFSQKPEALGKTIVTPKSDYLCDSDIALVILDRAITNVAPLPVRLDSGIRVGETIRSVGYGQNDKRVPIGTRLRKAGVAVLAMGSGISESKTALGSHEFEVGRSICQGDSGGPAISEETGAVIGVVSRGGDCTDDYGHIYTTTYGWSGLFDEAFGLAGGAPVLETGESRDDEAAPGAMPEEPPPAQPPRGASSSCSASHTSAPSGAAPGGLAIAAALACAMVRRRRRAP